MNLNLAAGGDVSRLFPRVPWCLTLVLVVLGSTAISGHGQAFAKKTPEKAWVNTVTRDGLRLTVSVPKPTEPRGSLVLATFKIGNLTSQPVRFAAWCIFGYTRPAILNGRRESAYPPAFTRLFPVSPCRFTHVYDLSAIPAGYQATVRRFVVLRGRFVGFAVTVASVVNSHIASETTVPSGAAVVRLTPRTAHPMVGFTVVGSRVIARITHLPKPGKVLMQAQAICRGGDVSRQLRWAAQQTIVAAPCAHPLRWRLAAGVKGYSVGVGTYQAT